MDSELPRTSQAEKDVPRQRGSTKRLQEAGTAHCQPSVVTTFCAYMTTPVRPCGFAEIILVLLTFCTGLQG